MLTGPANGIRVFSKKDALLLGFAFKIRMFDPRMHACMYQDEF